MPSNKNRDKIRREQQLQKEQAETTGKNEIIYKTVALCPVLEKGDVVYKIVEIEFTASKQLVSMVEVDSCRTQGTAMNKLENAVNTTLFNIKLLRDVAKKLKGDK
jgi:hypothetical protein